MQFFVENLVEIDKTGVKGDESGERRGDIFRNVGESV